MELSTRFSGKLVEVDTAHYNVFVRQKHDIIIPQLFRYHQSVLPSFESSQVCCFSSSIKKTVKLHNTKIML